MRLVMRAWYWMLDVGCSRHHALKQLATQTGVAT
jgi:hypothetical protein